MSLLKRHYTRLPISLDVSVRPPNEWVRCRTVDVSRRGLSRVESRPRSALLCAALLLAVAIGGAAGSAEAGAATAKHKNWKLAKSGAGVKAWMRDVPGSPIAMIRARTRIAATPLEVLAVINDVNKSCTWAGRCLEARVLRRHGPETRMYSRRQAPWPISDRDFELIAITRAVDGERLLRIDFNNVRCAQTPLPDGVVRMSLMRGHYQLKQAPGGATDVELQIEADPGGWLPKWIVRWTAKNGPFASLSGLRKRVPKVRHRYAKAIERMRLRLLLSTRATQTRQAQPAPARP